MQVADQLRSGGKVTRGWLGVTIQDVNRELAEALDMDKPFGALVSSILPESPASKSDLQVQDVIIEYNGKPVRHSSDLPFYVGRTVVGTAAKIKIMRGGKTRLVNVKIGQLPDSEMASMDTEEEHAEENKTGLLGMVVRDLSKEEKTQLDLDYGVLVEGVEEGSSAAIAGIKKGDIILMMNKQKMKNVKTYESTASKMKKDKSSAVLIKRGNGSQFLVLKP
jgi:serine protease Do